MKLARKLFVLTLCLCLVLACALVTKAEADSEIITGAYDGNVNWSYDQKSSVLRFSGTGVVRMDEGWWGKNCYEANTVVIEPGITGIESLGLGGVLMTEISIPDTVTYIGNQAFAHCEKLKSITIPGSVKTIGDWVFSSCTSLEMAIFEEGIEEIGDCVFFGCFNLKEVMLPDSFPYIPNSFLSECEIESLTIPSGTKEIRDYGLFGLKNMSSITIPANVEKIGGAAFTNTFSLTNVIFLGDAPYMEMPFFCASFNCVAFYPKGNPTWEEHLDDVMGQSGGLMAAIPYTVDSDGNIIPEAPSAKEVKEAISGFASQSYASGNTYPSNYSYVLNGNMLKVYGEEAFAFELSDACFGYLPVSEKRSVSYDALCVGDILYSGSDVWVITNKGDSGVELAGVQNGAVCYGESMTKAQVQKADAYRTRIGVSPYPGEIDPAQSLEKVTGPGRVLTEEEVYDLFVAQQAKFPQGMHYSEKDHYHSNVTWYVSEGVTVSQDGHGCSAFSGYFSDLAFGELPARYFDIGEVDYDSIMVGDRLFTDDHEMLVLEVYSDCVVVVEGNYDGRIRWGRTITRGEIESNYAMVTRYPEGTRPAARTAFSCGHKYMGSGWMVAPTCSQSGYMRYSCNSCDYSYTENEIPATGVHRYEDGFCRECYMPEPPVADQLEELAGKDASVEEIREVVQSIDTQKLTEALKENDEAAKDLAALEEKAGGAADVVVKDKSVGIAAKDVQIIGANLNEVTGDTATLTIAAPEKNNEIPKEYEDSSAVHFSMTLENVENTKELAVPVKVTLPIPQNLAPDRVAVIHYHGGGTEVLEPSVEKIGDKYYASVVLEGFSDFAMVQKVHEHSWSAATCEAPKTCKTCGETSGKKLGHSWEDATCTDPKTCKTCGTTSGKKLGHSWEDATCTDPKICKTCGETSNKALGHRWKDATCTEPKTCKTCGVTDGDVVHAYAHEFDYKCDACGKERIVNMTRPMVDMYRMYNPNTGEHFYTGSEVEKDNLVAVGWQYEGIGFTFPLTTGKPVYRLFQPSTGEHLYTMDEDEKAKLMAEGWNYEGIAFNSGFENEVPQYRLHNPNTNVGAYHFTASLEEKDNLIAAGWEFQGIGWYSLGA